MEVALPRHGYQSTETNQPRVSKGDNLLEWKKRIRFHHLMTCTIVVRCRQNRNSNVNITSTRRPQDVPRKLLLHNRIYPHLESPPLQPPTLRANVDLAAKVALVQDRPLSHVRALAAALHQKVPASVPYMMSSIISCRWKWKENRNRNEDQCARQQKMIPMKNTRHK